MLAIAFAAGKVALRLHLGREALVLLDRGQDSAQAVLLKGFVSGSEALSIDIRRVSADLVRIVAHQALLPYALLSMANSGNQRQGIALLMGRTIFVIL